MTGWHSAHALGEPQVYQPRGREALIEAYPKARLPPPRR